MSFIIQPPESKKTLRVVLSQETVSSMKEYCETAGIKKKDYFIEECIRYVLNNDQHWNNIVKKNRSYK